MPRTASATGSLWSSPSTSTVKTPVIVPSPVARAGALEELRQLREDSRRIALGSRRLAGRQADLALRHGEARDRIDHAEDVALLVAEIFGEGKRQIGRLAPHQGRLVRGRHDDDRACQPFLAEIVLQELLHLAPALADEPDHRDPRGDVAREHRQKDGLADARAGEDAHALAAAAGREGVERAHAEVERRCRPAGAGAPRRRLRPEADRASGRSAAAPSRRPARRAH